MPNNAYIIRDMVLNCCFCFNVNCLCLLLTGAYKTTAMHPAISNPSRRCIGKREKTLLINDIQTYDTPNARLHLK